MPRRKYCVLNVVAQPHPSGIYRKLFMAASNNRASNYRADHFARVSPVTEIEHGMFRGRLAIWTELNPKEPTINKQSFDQKLLADSDIALPNDIGFNSKIFYFSFNVENHKLFIELQNDEGQTVSAGIARLAIEKILQRVEPEFDVDVKVYIATTKSGLETVLSVASIRKIEIRVDLPNPDDISDDASRVLEKIQRRKIKRFVQEETKLREADTLVLLEEDRVLAELSKDNGFTRVWGQDKNNKRVELSTSDFPDIRVMELDKDDSSYRQLGFLARNDGDEQES